MAVPPDDFDEFWRIFIVRSNQNKDIKIFFMQRKGSFLLTGLLLFGYLAVNANYENGQSNIGKDSLPPVETKPGFANYKPAFAGQTRIAGAKTNTPYKVEKIANKLGNPFAIAAMPDGRLMVTLKSGTMEIHDKNGVLVKRSLDCRR